MVVSAFVKTSRARPGAGNRIVEFARCHRRTANTCVKATRDQNLPVEEKSCRVQLSTASQAASERPEPGGRIVKLGGDR